MIAQHFLAKNEAPEVKTKRILLKLEDPALNKKVVLIICSEWSQEVQSLPNIKKKNLKKSPKNYFLVMGWTGFVLWKAFYQLTKRRERNQ